MTMITITQLTCDEIGCSASWTGTVYDHALDRGWGYRPAADQDLCPEHDPRARTLAETHARALAETDKEGTPRWR